MKKLLLSLLMAVGLASVTSAQTNELKFGIKAGVAFPNWTVSNGGFSVSFKTNTSFYIGGTVDVAINETFAVQPGLTLIGKGAKITATNDGIYTEKFSTLNLEIPVNLMAGFEAGPGKIFVGAGPYYAYALSGQTKLKYSNRTEKEDIEFGSSSEDMLKRSDFGLNFLAGYQLTNGLNIHAGYGIGLSNIASSSDEGKIKNKVFSVGIGFSF